MNLRYQTPNLPPSSTFWRTNLPLVSSLKEAHQLNDGKFLFKNKKEAQYTYFS